MTNRAFVFGAGLLKMQIKIKHHIYLWVKERVRDRVTITVTRHEKRLRNAPF